MALYAVVPVHLAVRQQWRVSEVVLSLMLDGLAYDDLGEEHLELTIRESGSILVAIGAVDGKVVGSAPHAAWAELHVEALLAFVDHGRLGLARAMIEVPDLNILLAAILLSEVVDLCLENGPEVSVLDALDPGYLGSR